LSTSHQFELDGSSHQQHSQDASGRDLDCRSPCCSSSIAPRFEQITQLANVSRSMSVFQAEMGQATLGTTLSSAGEQVVQIFRAQMGGP
jgi:hypothetical protein